MTLFFVLVEKKRCERKVNGRERDDLTESAELTMSLQLLIQQTSLSFIFSSLNFKMIYEKKKKKY
jgi:hypothetical protein